MFLTNKMTGQKEINLVGVIAVLVVLFFTTVWHRRSSLERVKAQQLRLQAACHEQPMAAVAVFSAVFIPVVETHLAKIRITTVK